MLVWLLTTVLLHPVHATVSEVQWNDQTHRLEVALRLHVLDEQWLQRRHTAEKEPFSQWAPEHLKNKFRIDPPSEPGRATDATYHWVGRKQEGSHVWWFFEIEPKDASPPRVIDQRMLFEHDERYAHRIVVLGTDSPTSLKLHVREPSGRLKL